MLSSAAATLCRGAKINPTVMSLGKNNRSKPDLKRASYFYMSDMYIKEPPGKHASASMCSESTFSSVRFRI